RDSPRASRSGLGDIVKEEDSIMAAKVKLEMVDGGFEAQQFDFSDRTVCTIGRSKDCFLHVPDLWIYKNVARHHCLLHIDPPHVGVRDVGSKNGTYVNGHKIGQRDLDLPTERAMAPAQQEYPLKDGDEIKVGDIRFRIHIEGEQENVLDERAIA